MMVLVCGCSDGEDLEGITVSKDFISVTQSMELPGDGGTANFEVKATCPWSISNSASWLTISQTSGEESQSVTVSASLNSTGSPRTATVTVRASTLSRTITITQSTASAQLPGRDDNLPPDTGD